MPVGTVERRSPTGIARERETSADAPSRPRDSSRLAMRGFAAVRLAGPASSVRVSRSRAMPVGDRRSTVRLAGPASSALVSRSRAMPVGDRRSSREIGGASVVGAGFALPRDAGRRPALLAVRLAWPALSVRVSRSRAMPVGDRRSTVRLAGPASSALVSRSRAMPVGDRRSSREIGGASVVGDWRAALSFRAPARCRSETGAPP